MSQQDNTTDERQSLERMAQEYARGDECEVMDTYSAHAQSFSAGYIARDAEVERMELLLNNLRIYLGEEKWEILVADRHKEGEAVTFEEVVQQAFNERYQPESQADLYHGGLAEGWDAGVEWTLTSEVVRGMAEALELEGKALTMRGMLPMPEHITKALTAYREAVGEGSK